MDWPNTACALTLTLPQYTRAHIHHPHFGSITMWGPARDTRSYLSGNITFAHSSRFNCPRLKGALCSGLEENASIDEKSTFCLLSWCHRSLVSQCEADEPWLEDKPASHQTYSAKGQGGRMWAQTRSQSGPRYLEGTLGATPVPASKSDPLHDGALCNQ